ncbi:MAG: conserved exported protein of unknown function [Nitrospira sp.]|nr:MAG: conserved exported protein of unknown function [Nitrospira sp.]
MCSIFPKTLRMAVMLLAAGCMLGTGVERTFADSLSASVPALAELRSQTQGEVVYVPATNERRADLFRQSPVLSGRLRVSEQTLIPYIGAGFGGGYVTERDRALGPQPALPQQNLFGESMGKSMMPNEFQMGIRIPF